jgi:hypothetical protein
MGISFILMAREYDTGSLPPGFFVKIVLGRSLRENAPPTVS